MILYRKKVLNEQQKAKQKEALPKVKSLKFVRVFQKLCALVCGKEYLLAFIYFNVRMSLILPGTKEECDKKLKILEKGIDIMTGKETETSGKRRWSSSDSSTDSEIEDKTVKIPIKRKKMDVKKQSEDEGVVHR